MQKNTQRHRHFLAVPALVLTIALTSIHIEGNAPHSASVTSVRSQGSSEHFTFSSGVYGVVTSGVVHDYGHALTMEKGAAIIATTGVSELHVGTRMLVSVDGAYHITVTGDDVTVSALTAPVVIVQGHERMIVPVGTQWNLRTDERLHSLKTGFAEWHSGRRVQPIPKHFALRQHQSLRTLSPVVVSLPRSALLPSTVSTFDSVLLPVAKRNATRSNSEDILGVIRSVIESDDVGGLSAMLAQESVRSAVSSMRGRQVLVALLRKDFSAAMKMRIVEQLSSNDHMWLSLSFHPQYRSLVFASEQPKSSVESTLVRAFTLPFGDLATEGMSDFVMERYAAVVQSIIEDADDSTDIVESLSTTLYPLVEQLENAGYPHRSRRLAVLLQVILSELEELPASLSSLRLAIHQLYRQEIGELPPIVERTPEPEPEPEPEPDPTPEPDPILSALEVKQRAESMLRSADALTTIETHIDLVADNTVRIRNVVFPTARGQRLVHFSLNAFTHTVSLIEIEGISHPPLELPYHAFAAWLKS